MRRFIYGGLIASMLATSVAVAPAESATRYTLTAAFTAKQVTTGESYTLVGKVKPARAGVAVQRQKWVAGSWVTFGKRVKTNDKGRWTLQASAPAEPTTLKVRVIAPKVKHVATKPQTLEVVAPLPDPTVSMTTSASAFVANSIIRVSGKYAYEGKSISLSVQRQSEEQWLPVPLKGVSRYRSNWTGLIELPNTAGTFVYRTRAITERGDAFSAPLTLEIAPRNSELLDAVGPGPSPRIWGIDVARYQHQTSSDGMTGQPIDWEKAYNKGIRFAFIKASDGQANADRVARRWAMDDYVAAKAAGIYTGLYHYPGMPDTDPEANQKTALIKDAREEAIQAAARLAELGGYGSMDLPYVLDVESDNHPGSGIASLSTSASVTLWVKTWLLEMQARTGRMPIVYGSPSFLAKELIDDPFWDDVPLWLARYSCSTNPVTRVCEQVTHTEAISRLNAGLTVGNYVTPWTTKGTTNWSFWQYSSRGIGADFGIQNGTSLDMNVFRGSSAEFLELTRLIWTPAPGDYQTSVAETAIAVEHSDRTVSVSVARATDDSRLAVSGNLAVRINGKAVSGTNVVSDGVGTWKITIPASVTFATDVVVNVKFSDSFDFYAPSETTYTIAAVTENPVSPSASPTA